MTDLEINEAVARKLGWWNFDIGIGGTPEDKARGGWDGKLIAQRRHSDNLNVGWEEVPDYCGSIAAAWEIVEKYSKLDEEGFYFELSRNPFHWEAGWTDSSHSTWRTFAEADTAPMAICLAFLKLE